MLFRSQGSTYRRNDDDDDDDQDFPGKGGNKNADVTSPLKYAEGDGSPWEINQMTYTRQDMDDDRQQFHRLLMRRDVPPEELRRERDAARERARMLASGAMRAEGSGRDRHEMACRNREIADALDSLLTESQNQANRSSMPDLPNLEEGLRNRLHDLWASTGRGRRSTSSFTTFGGVHISPIMPRMPDLSKGDAPPPPSPPAGSSS